MSTAESAYMHDEYPTQNRELPMTEEQATVLRKHLARNTMSLDDAAVLVGIPVEELSRHFQGRRASHAQAAANSSEEREHRRRRRRSKPYVPDESNDIENAGLDLHAPERRIKLPKGGGALWAGGALAAFVVVGGLALLSGIPQSLLFPPRGVSEHKADVTAATAEAPLTADATAAAVPPGAAETAAPSAVDPVTAEAQPEAVADPAADPSAAPPGETTVAEAPLPPAPEEVPPAVAEGETAVIAAPEAPSLTAPEAPPLAAPEPPVAAEAAQPAAPPAGPAAAFYATRQATVRDTPTATGSATLAQIKRGESISGSLVAGADGKSSWLKIESGPGAGGFVSATNMSPEPRPSIAQAIGKPRTLVQAAALHAGPDEGSKTLDTLNPGISVLAAAEVAGGWIEIHRRAGGVGYIRKEAFE